MQPRSELLAALGALYAKKHGGCMQTAETSLVRLS